MVFEIVFGIIIAFFLLATMELWLPVMWKLLKILLGAASIFVFFGVVFLFLHVMSGG